MAEITLEFRLEGDVSGLAVAMEETTSDVTALGDESTKTDQIISDLVSHATDGFATLQDLIGSTSSRIQSMVVAAQNVTQNIKAAAANAIAEVADTYNSSMALVNRSSSGSGGASSGTAVDAEVEDTSARIWALIEEARNVTKSIRETTAAAVAEAAEISASSLQRSQRSAQSSVPQVSGTDAVGDPGIAALEASAEGATGRVQALAEESSRLAQSLQQVNASASGEALANYSAKLDQASKAGQESAKGIEATSSSSAGSSGIMASFGNVIELVSGKYGKLIELVNAFKDSPVGAYIIEAVTAYQGYDKALTEATGSAAGAKVAFAKLDEFAARTPVTLQEATEAFTTLKSAGLTPSIQALTSYGNIAAGTNKKLADVVSVVGEASQGQYDKLTDLGIKVAEQGDSLKLTYGGVSTSVKQDASAIEGYLMKLGETQFADAMGEQMDTLPVMFDRVNQQLSGVVVDIYRLFEPSATSVWKDSLALMGDGVDYVVEKMGALRDWIQGGIGFDWLMAEAELWWDSLTAGFGGSGAAILETMGGVWQGIVDGATAMLEWVTGGIFTSFGGLLEFLTDFGSQAVSLISDAFANFPLNMKVAVTIMLAEGEKLWISLNESIDLFVVDFESFTESLGYYWESMTLNIRLLYAEVMDWVIEQSAKVLAEAASWIPDFEIFDSMREAIKSSAAALSDVGSRQQEINDLIAQEHAAHQENQQVLEAKRQSIQTTAEAERSAADAGVQAALAERQAAMDKRTASVAARQEARKAQEETEKTAGAQALVKKTLDESSKSAAGFTKSLNENSKAAGNLTAEGQRLTEQYYTPSERFEATLARYKLLYNENTISVETYARAVRDLTKTYLEQSETPFDAGMKTLAEEAKQLGLTERERAAYNAELAYTNKMLSEHKELNNDEIAALRAQALANYDLGEQIKQRAKEEAAAKTQWENTAKSISDGLTGAFVGWVTKSENLAENLRNSLREMFNSLVLQPKIQAIMTSISNDLTTSLLGYTPSSSGAVVKSVGDSSGVGFSPSSLLSYVPWQGLGTLVLGDTIMTSAGVTYGTGFMTTQSQMLAAQEMGMGGMSGVGYGGLGIGGYLGYQATGSMSGAVTGAVLGQMGMGAIGGVMSGAGASAGVTAALQAIGPYGWIALAALAIFGDGLLGGGYTAPFGSLSTSSDESDLWHNKNGEFIGAESVFGYIGLTSDAHHVGGEKKTPAMQAYFDGLAEIDNALAQFLTVDEIADVKTRLDGWESSSTKAFKDFESMMQERLSVILTEVDPALGNLLAAFDGSSEEIAEYAAGLLAARKVVLDINAFLEALEKPNDPVQAIIDQLAAMDQAVANAEAAAIAAAESGDPTQIAQMAEQLKQAEIARYQQSIALVYQLQAAIEETERLAFEFSLRLTQKIESLTGVGSLTSAPGSGSAQIYGAGAEVYRRYMESTDPAERMRYLEYGEGLVDKWIQAREQEINRWLEAEMAAIDAQRSALQAQREQVQQRYQAEQEAIQEAINLTQEWQGVLDGVQRMLDSLRYSGGNPLSSSARYSILGSDISALESQLAGASAEDRAGIAQQLLSLYEQQAQMMQAGDLFQLPSEEYQAQYNSLVLRLGELQGMAQAETDRGEQLQEELNSLTEQQNAELASIDAQLAELDAQAAQLQEQANAELEAMRAEAAGYYAWIQAEGEGYFSETLATQQAQLDAILQGRTAEEFAVWAQDQMVASLQTIANVLVAMSKGDPFSEAMVVAALGVGSSNDSYGSDTAQSSADSGERSLPEGVARSATAKVPDLTPPVPLAIQPSIADGRPVTVAIDQGAVVVQVSASGGDAREIAASVGPVVEQALKRFVSGPFRDEVIKLAPALRRAQQVA